MLGEPGTVRFDAGIEIIADHLSRLEALSYVSAKRYMQGKAKEVLTRDGEIVPITEFDPDDARVSIAAMDAIGKRLPIMLPEKVALTNPEGDRPYESLSTDELLQRVKELSGASRT
jgi:hypothetical protein